MEPLDYFRMRRTTYYSLTTEHTDDFGINNIPVVENEDTVIKDAYEYLTINTVDEMRYPGKSYAIAILYAHWLGQLGVGSLYGNLELEDLLGEDDPYYKHLSPEHGLYSSIGKTYIEIMEKINYNLPDLYNVDSYCHLKYLMMTREYFFKEFMLCPKQREILPFIPGWEMTFNFGKNFYSDKRRNRDLYLKNLCKDWLSDSPLQYRVLVNKDTGIVRIVPSDNNYYEILVGPDVFHPIPTIFYGV